MPFIISNAAGKEQFAPYAPADTSRGLSYEDASRERDFWLAKADEPGAQGGAYATARHQELVDALAEYDESFAVPVEEP